MCVSTLLLFGCAAPPGKPTPAKPIVLKWADPSAYGTMRTVMNATWGKMLEKKSKEIGKPIKFEWYWAGSLAKARDIYETVKGGLAPVGLNSIITYHPKVWPIWYGFELPFLFGGDYHVHGLVRYEMYHTVPELKKEIENSGIRPIAITSYEGTCLFGKKPIVKWEDLKGLKVGAKGPVASVIKRGGAVPVGITTYEYYEALQKGTVASVTGYITTYLAFKIPEVAKHLTRTGLQNYAVMPLINPDAYHELPIDIQRLFDESWILYQKWQSEGFDEAQKRDIGIMQKDYKVKVYKLDPKELNRWVENAKPVWEKWLKDMEARGVDGKKILDTYGSLYRKYEKYSHEEIYKRFAELYKEFYGRDLKFLEKEVIGKNKYPEYREMLGIIVFRRKIYNEHDERSCQGGA